MFSEEEIQQEENSDQNEMTNEDDAKHRPKGGTPAVDQVPQRQSTREDTLTSVVLRYMQLATARGTERLQRGETESCNAEGDGFNLFQQCMGSH